MKLQRIKEITNDASPVENWRFGVNFPFYVDVRKPAPSLSKHDHNRPTYWKYEDGLFVNVARYEMPNLIEALELAIEGLKDLADPMVGPYSVNAQLVLDEIEKKFKND